MAQLLFPVHCHDSAAHCHNHRLDQFSISKIFLTQDHFLFCTLTLEIPLHNPLAQKYLHSWTLPCYPCRFHAPWVPITILTHTFRAFAFYWVFRLIWWNSDPGSIPLSTHPLLTSKQLNTAGEKSHIMSTKFKLKIYNLQPQINPQDCFQLYISLVILFTHLLGLLLCIFSS